MSELENKVSELKIKHKITSDDVDYLELGLKKTYLDGRYTLDQLENIVAAMEELQLWKANNA